MLQKIKFQSRKILLQRQKPQPKKRNCPPLYGVYTEQAMKIFSTLRFLSPLSTVAQNLALSFSSAHMPKHLSFPPDQCRWQCKQLSSRFGLRCEHDRGSRPETPPRRWPSVLMLTLLTCSSSRIFALRPISSGVHFFLS